MKCDCSEREKHQVLDTLVHIERELVAVAKRMVSTATDPFTAVIRFLHERPEGTSLPGFVVDRVLLETFGHPERIPGLIHVLSKHVDEIRRHSNVIKIVSRHSVVERWGHYVIKKKEHVKFEVVREKEKLVLKNIVGMNCVENGIEAHLEKIVVNAPKLEVFCRFGFITAKRVVDIN